MKHSFADNYAGSVFLDRIEMRDVVRCDDDAGEVVVLVRGSHDEFLIDNGQFVERILRGRVLFVPRGF